MSSKITGSVMATSLASFSRPVIYEPGTLARLGWPIGLPSSQVAPARTSREAA